MAVISIVSSAKQQAELSTYLRRDVLVSIRSQKVLPHICMELRFGRYGFD